MCTVSVLYFCKGQWSKVVCKLSKGMWVQVFLLYFLADWICISQGAGLSVICSSRLNLHFSGYWAEYYMLPIANSWIVPLYAISELIGLQAGLFTVAFFFFFLELWVLLVQTPHDGTSVQIIFIIYVIFICVYL